MSRVKAWIAISAATVAAIVVLFLIAGLRYSLPLVDPAPPAPDYALQATIAYVGAGAVGATGIIAGLAVHRGIQRRARAALIGILCIVAVCIVAVIAALVIPAA